MGLVIKLGLQLQNLDFVRFGGLTMKTADHEDTGLHHWVCLNVGVEDIWSQIGYFVSPAMTNSSNILKASESSQSLEPLNLLLGIPWLYSVNT